MKPITYCCLMAGILAAPSTLCAVTPIATGHTDVGIGYEGGAFDLHVHDEENDTEYSPSDALLVVRSQAVQTSPGGAYNFLGPSGTPVWVLPKVENSELLYLGLGTEELVRADWLGNVEFSLKAVSGPGNFFLWDTDVFGNPQVKMDSTDGIGPGDVVSLIPGSHSHLNWGFSAPGTYSISFEATGIHVADGPQNSGPVAYNFQVVPEPGQLALAAVGLAALTFLGRNRRR